MADTRHAPGAQRGYETRDVNLRAIVVFSVALVVVCLVAAVAMLWTFRYLDSRLVESDARVSPLAMPAGQLPPEPRQQQDELVTTYGWIDKNAGIVRIPVERAKELILERGLPTR
jgi:hypothetical protein